MKKKAKKSATKPAKKKALSKPKKMVSESFKIVPLGDKVIVRPALADEKTTPGGIIIPDTIDKEKPERGTVVAVGNGKWDRDKERVPMSVKVGDTVVFSKYGYDELKLDGEEYYVIKEENILAVIKN